MIKHTVIAIGMTALAGAAAAGQTQADMKPDVDAMEKMSFGQSFAMLDADDNSRINWSEAENHIPQSVFKSADADGNGWLNKVEFKAVEVSASAGDGRQTGAEPTTGGSIHAMEHEPFGQSFAALDADDNGRINWSEAENHIPKSVFKSADADGNGWLNKVEFKAVEVGASAGDGRQTGAEPKSGN